MLASSKAGKIPHIPDITPEVDLNETTGSVRSAKEMMPYNKLLTNLACSSRTGLRSVRTVTTSGQYSPVRPSRSVSKRLKQCIASHSKLKLNYLWKICGYPQFLC